MNDKQARCVRKLKVEQDCSYPTIARKFHQEFGETDYCNKNNATSALYFNLDKVSDGVQVHNFDSGPIPVNEYKLVEYLFSPEVGESLCNAAVAFLNKFSDEGWSGFDYSEASVNEYEKSTG
jgi:hypothetical protein